MHDIPCKIVDADTFPPENPFSSLRRMLYRLQFIHLTPQQKSQLEYLIAHFIARPNVKP